VATAWKATHTVGVTPFHGTDGLELHVDDAGGGPTVVLLHGFAADARLNWSAPGVTAALVAAGRRVVAPDARGHGRSAKPHDAAAYAGDTMAHDVTALADQLGLDRFDLVGYSMGALVAQRVAVLEPRVRSLVLGGIGGHVLLAAALDREEIAAVLRRGPGRTASPTARAFRAFARRTGADPEALAASQEAGRPALDRIHEIRVPTLVVAGAADRLAGDPAVLAARIPGARSAVVPGDHLTAVRSPELARALVAFLAEVSPVL